MALSWPASVYLEALAITVGCEVPLVTLAARSAGLRGPSGRVVAVAIAANLLTHGLLWTLFPLVPGPYAARLVAFETAVFVAEGLVFVWRLGWPVPIAIGLSFAVNLLTTVIGLVRG